MSLKRKLNQFLGGILTDDKTTNIGRFEIKSHKLQGKKNGHSFNDFQSEAIAPFRLQYLSQLKGTAIRIPWTIHSNASYSCM